ncbi:MAG: hypothetical protein OXE94_00625 [Aestuariivita sp.]|nr:hypothetical protein [Aestuariivita sp.]MCY4201673.1 hypothetical protein [Aestuariivita sp.]
MNNSRDTYKYYFKVVNKIIYVGASCKIHQANDFFLKTGDFFENGGHETTLCILDCDQHKIQRWLSHALIEYDSRYQEAIARGLFPTLAQDLGPLTANHQRFVAVLDLKPVETFIQTHSSGRGGP